MLPTHVENKIFPICLSIAEAVHNVQNDTVYNRNAAHQPTFSFILK